MTLFEEVNRQKSLMGIIAETINQANKLLAQSGMDQDHPQIAAIREVLEQYKKMAWYGIFVKFYLNENIPVRVIEPLIKKLASKQIKLPKPVEKFANFSELNATVNQLVEDRKLYLFINKIPSGRLKDDVVKEIYGLSKAILEFMELDPKCIKMFFKKIKRIEIASHLNDELKVYISNNADGRVSINTDIIKTVNELGDGQAQVVFSEGNVTLIRVKTFQASETLGSRAWCIVQDQQQFHGYTEDNKRLYFLINSNIPICDNEQSIGYVMTEENELYAAHYKNDAEMSLNHVKPYLKNLGILETVYVVNQRETIKDSKSTLYNFINNEGSLSQLGEQLSKGQNLDIIVEKLENLPVNYMKWDKEPYRPKNQARIFNDPYDKKIIESSFDLLTYFFHHLETGGYINLFGLVGNASYNVDDDTYSTRRLFTPLFKALMGGKSPDEFVKILHSLFISGSFQPVRSKRNFFHLLKAKGYDLMKSTQQLKNKTGEDLTDNELGVSTKQGDDHRAYIQNKIHGFIHDGSPLSHKEASLAVEYGLSEPIKRYYKEFLRDPINVITYEHVQILQQLGMMNEVGDFVVSKESQYGVDTLNSIEKSILDHAKHINV